MLSDTPCNSFNNRRTTKLLSSNFLSSKVLSRDMQEGATSYLKFKIAPHLPPGDRGGRQFSHVQIAI